MEEVAGIPEKAEAEDTQEGATAGADGTGSQRTAWGRAGAREEDHPEGKAGIPEKPCRGEPALSILNILIRRPSILGGVHAITSRNTKTQPKVHKTHIRRCETQAKVLFVL